MSDHECESDNNEHGEAIAVLHEKVARLERETSKLSGAVDALEQWQSRVFGALSAVSAIVGVAAWCVGKFLK